MKKIILFICLVNSFVFLGQTNKYNLADKSVFKIIAYDFSNQSISQGSGFFISANGIGITNLHVLDNVDSAYIITNSGKEYKITTIIDYSSKYDLIKFKINTVNSIPVSYSTNQDGRGDDVFALGYPCGLEISGSSTLSKGIISATRNIDQVDYIQTSAQITHGSSGGGLFDNFGKLIGITQGTFASSLEDVHANLYKVIPAKYIKLLNQTKNLSFKQLKYQNSDINLAKFELLKTNGNLVEAETLITEMLKNDILNARLWNKYASILGSHNLDNKELAFSCYENAIKLDPSYIPYYSNYAITCSEYSMNSKALEILNKINTPNTDSHYYYALGYCFTALKNYDQAVEYLKTSIDLFDDKKDSEEIFKKTYYELAYNYKNLKKYELSKQTCDILILTFPDYFTPYNLRAQNYYYLGDHKSACEDFNFVIQNGDEINRNRALDGFNSICK